MPGWQNETLSVQHLTEAVTAYWAATKGIFELNHHIVFYYLVAQAAILWMDSSIVTQADKPSSFCAR